MPSIPLTPRSPAYLSKPSLPDLLTSDLKKIISPCHFLEKRKTNKQAKTGLSRPNRFCSESGQSSGLKVEQLVKLIGGGYLHHPTKAHTLFFFPTVSPGAGRLVFCARMNCGEQLLFPDLVQRKEESVVQHSSPKYPTRLTRSGARESQLMLSKVLCVESKRLCVSETKNFLSRCTLCSLREQDNVS